jgi:TonB family protein
MRRADYLILVVALASGLFTSTSSGQAPNHAERKVVTRVAPVYPELAKRMHVSGVVRLEVVVGANGSVKSAKALGGNPVLIGPATEALRQWKFETAREESNQVVQLTFAPH